MRVLTRSVQTAALALVAASATAQDPAPLALDQLLGTWNMAYDMGQGPQSGTITVSRSADGSPKILMSTTSGGDSEARDIRIEGDAIRYARDITAQGLRLTVRYTAKLVDGRLEGTFEIDLGELAGAAGGLGGPTPWTATRAD